MSACAIIQVSSAGILFLSEGGMKMTGSVYEKDGKWYIRLSYKDKNNKWAQKWVSTGYEIKGNKRNAEAMIPELIDKNKHLDYSEPQSNNRKISFAEAAKQ